MYTGRRCFGEKESDLNMERHTEFFDTARPDTLQTNRARTHLAPERGGDVFCVYRDDIVDQIEFEIAYRNKMKVERDIHSRVFHDSAL